MNTPHVHRDLIIAWANGATIEQQDDKTLKWHTLIPSFAPEWHSWATYRVKPEVIRYKRWLTQGNRVAICYGEQVIDPVGLSYFHSWIDTEWQEIEAPQ